MLIRQFESTELEGTVTEEPPTEAPAAEEPPAVVAEEPAAAMPLPMPEDEARRLLAPLAGRNVRLDLSQGRFAGGQVVVVDDDGAVMTLHPFDTTTTVPLDEVVTVAVRDNNWRFEDEEFLVRDRRPNVVRAGWGLFFGSLLGTAGFVSRDENEGDPRRRAVAVGGALVLSGFTMAMLGGRNVLVDDPRIVAGPDDLADRRDR